MTRINSDYWVNHKNIQREICDPRWTDFELMINELNGQDKTLVTFGDYEDGYYMAVGGGLDNKYIVYVSLNDEEIVYDLLNGDDTSDSMISLIVGGQLGQFPMCTHVSKEIVLIAAHTFFETQHIDSSLQWRK